MSHHSHFRPSPKLAAIALLAAACVLGGCGRKGPLDLPPNAAVQPGPLDIEGGEVPANQGGPGDAAGAATAQGNVFGSGSGRRGTTITAPPGPKKRIILDPILD